MGSIKRRFVRMESRWIITLFSVILLSIFEQGLGLECYVCTTQTGNTEKCLRTIKTCEPGEDYCLTTIAWGSLPYWTASAEKSYFVSKQCATKELCERTWNETLPYCERIWYLDWRCSECCQGDRCNYFVTLGASALKFSICLVAAGILTAIYRLF